MNPADSDAAKATPDDQGSSIRTRITDQYAHIMESLRVHEFDAAEDHALEVLQLVKDARRITRNTPKTL